MKVLNPAILQLGRRYLLALPIIATKTGFKKERTYGGDMLYPFDVQALQDSSSALL